MQAPEKEPVELIKETRFIKFLGGKNLLFTLTLGILFALVIYLYSKISYIFQPIFIFMSTASLPIIIAVALYYPLNSIVTWLEKKRLRRLWGTILVFLCILLLFISLFSVIIPLFIEQITTFSYQFPAILRSTEDKVAQLTQGTYFQDSYQQIFTWLNSNFSSLPSQLIKSIGTTLNSLNGIISQISSISVAILTAPFVLFYMLKDEGKFKSYTLNFFPPKFHPFIQDIAHDINLQVGAYIQGQLVVCTFIGSMLYIGYLIIGLNYGLALAILAGITSFVPYVGPFIGIMPAIIIAAFHSPFMLVKMIIVWLIVQTIEGNLVSPNIIGKNLNIHPLTVIFVLIVAGEIAGVPGFIIGIPCYAIFRVFVSHLFQLFKLRYNWYFGMDNPTYLVSEEKQKETLTPSKDKTWKEKIYHLFFYPNETL